MKKKATKTKTGVKTVSSPEKKNAENPLKMPLLVWILSGLSYISISTLVPMFFGEGNQFFNGNEESLISGIWVYEIALFIVPIFIISFIVSLALSKEYSSANDLKSVLRKTFVVASVINVLFIVVTLYFDQFLSLVGINI